MNSLNIRLSVEPAEGFDALALCKQIDTLLASEPINDFRIVVDDGVETKVYEWNEDRGDLVKESL